MAVILEITDYESNQHFENLKSPQTEVLSPGFSKFSTIYGII